MPLDAPASGFAHHPTATGGLRRTIGSHPNCVTAPMETNVSSLGTTMFDLESDCSRRWQELTLTRQKAQEVGPPSPARGHKTRISLRESCKVHGERLILAAPREHGQRNLIIRNVNLFR